MKKFILLTFLFSLSTTQAENSRAPAVLDGTCQLKVDLSKFKNAEEAQIAHCKAVRQCMYSAPDEQMPMLKNLEAAACSNTLKVMAPQVPTLPKEPSFDGKRKAKPEFDKDGEIIDAKPTVIGR
jgi:hypothetical protein